MHLREEKPGRVCDSSRVESSAANIERIILDGVNQTEIKDGVQRHCGT